MFGRGSASSHSNRSGGGDSDRSSGSRKQQVDSQHLSSSQQSRHVRFTNERLFEMAATTASGADWDSLVRPGRVPDGLATTRSHSRVSVTASAVAACSVAEMLSVIRPAVSTGYSTTMREMFGSGFIYGAVVHRATNQEESLQPSASAFASSKLGRSKNKTRAKESSVRVRLRPVDAQVKTITFAKRHFLALSEQWCILDALHEVEGMRDDAFAVTMTSVHPDDVFFGKTHARTVSALTDISAAYAVVRTPLVHDKSGKSGAAEGQDPAWGVRITFRTECDTRVTLQSEETSAPSSSRAKLHTQGLSARAVTRRLQELANATLKLVDVVRARRLNAQIYVDPRAAALAVPPSAKTRCACCTRLFLSATRRKQCHLCGFFVCASCSVVHELPRAGGRRFLVRVCAHCLEWVDDGCYDNLPLGTAQLPPQIAPDASSGDRSGVKLRRALTDALTSSSTSPTRKAAVRSVIRLLKQQQDEEEAELRASNDQVVNRESSNSWELTDDSTDAEHLQALDTLTHGQQVPPLGSFAVAGSRSRNYPIAKTTDANGGVSSRPIPRDEEQRLRWLAATASSESLSEIKDVPELDVLCELAKHELDCRVGMVVAVAQDEAHVLATSDPSYSGVVFPREQTICSHAIMDHQPLLVPHPEADVRFCQLDGVRGSDGCRFYFGFPLRVPRSSSDKAGDAQDGDGDGPVIGTLCCSDMQSHTVTESQYAAMEKLARSAARILEERRRRRQQAAAIA